MVILIRHGEVSIAVFCSFYHIKLDSFIFISLLFEEPGLYLSWPLGKLQTMKIKNWLIPLIAILFVVTNCKKEEEFEYKVFDVNPKLYPFLFDTCSSWVYNNPVTNEIDNVTIVNMSIGTYPPGYSSDSYMLVYSFSCLSTYQGESYYHACQNIISKNIHISGLLFIASGVIGDKRENARIDTIYDLFDVNGVSYKDVVKMDIEEDWWIENEMNLYWADSVGIVKKEIKENGVIVETWNLQSYDVVLYNPQ